MQFSKIALAVVAACAAAGVTAAPNASRIALSAGSSSIQNNLRLAVESLCKAPNVATSFVKGNFTTVVCADVSLPMEPCPQYQSNCSVARPSALYSSKPNAQFKNFAGLPFAEIRFNSTNGSFGSVQILNGVPFEFLDPSTARTNDPTLGGVVIGGISDIEIDRFPASTIGANTLFANPKIGVAQTFGVAASAALYTKMFDAQKLAGKIPAVCTVNDTALPYCIPNIAKAQMATIMAANEFNQAWVKGLEFLTNDPADNAVELRYVRRVDTSGTQAAAQNYFLGQPCAANQLSIVAEPTTVDRVGGFIANAKIENIRVYAAPGTGEVLAQLNNVDADGVAVGIQAGVYALGVVSGENNQTGQNWRWLRVDGAPIGENAAPGSSRGPQVTNTNTLMDGSYSFYYEATYIGGNTQNENYWDTIRSQLQSMPWLRGLATQATLDSGYNKGGATCMGSSSN
jgi:hypothetical protein